MPDTVVTPQSTIFVMMIYIELCFAKVIIIQKNISCHQVEQLIEYKNEIMKTWEIGNELEKELVNSIVDSGSDSWTKLLNECLKK